MQQLIEALQIFAKYAPTLEYPTNCEHDTLMVMIDPALVSDEDKGRLEALSFYPDEEHFYSYKFGSA